MLPSGSTASTRIRALDWHRGIAVLVMIECHALVFLGATHAHDRLVEFLNSINGLVAPSFLFIAGFVQGMERGVAPEKPVNFARRARQLVLLGVTGYALHFPWPELARHDWEAAVRVGTQVDVLQCIAASLGLLLAITWVAQ